MLKKENRADSRDVASLRGGKVMRTKHLLFSYTRIQDGRNSRITCSVAKKVARRAVDRNRLKRECRHAVKHALPSLTQPIIGIVRIMSADTTWNDFTAEIEDVFKKVQ